MARAEQAAPSPSEEPAVAEEPAGRAPRGRAGRPSGCRRRAGGARAERRTRRRLSLTRSRQFATCFAPRGAKVPCPRLHCQTTSSGERYEGRTRGSNQHQQSRRLTGNLTRDPELRSTPGGTSVCSLRSRSTAGARTNRRMGRQAQLLRRDRLGRAGRELRPVPREGPPRGGRRPPRLARVGGQGRRQAAVRRYHCRLGAVPGLARRSPDATARSSPTFPPTPPTSSQAGVARAVAARTTTSRSSGSRAGGPG